MKLISIDDKVLSVINENPEIVEAPCGTGFYPSR